LHDRPGLFPPAITIELMNRFSRERQIPLALIGSGLVLAAVGIMWKLGPSRLPLALAALACTTLLGAALMLIAAFLTAWMIGASFGEMRSAILKLAAVYVLPTSLDAALPLWVAFIVTGVVSLLLLMWLFDLEMREARVFAGITMAVNLIVWLGIAAVVWPWVSGAIQLPTGGVNASPP
jgi:hypothetical protein